VFAVVDVEVEGSGDGARTESVSDCASSVERVIGRLRDARERPRAGGAGAAGGGGGGRADFTVAEEEEVEGG